ncbi:MAG: 3-hydroxylacyl-ACP dehydratase [Betaproteobacteria bacterium]|nr:3-hydroxylacyl-ACP dehydratase [Betaproteobacteria bacterium]
MSYRPIIDYLPHRPPMVLLDRVVEVEELRIVCEVAIKVDSPYCDGAAVPGWVGVEYMAQSVGALSGWRSLARGLPVKVGFLVGTRHYQSHVPEFRVGEMLRVAAAEELMTDDGLAMMRCTLHNADGALLAEASLMVFQPDDVDAYLRQSASPHESAAALQ